MANAFIDLPVVVEPPLIAKQAKACLAQSHYPEAPLRSFFFQILVSLVPSAFRFILGQMWPVHPLPKPGFSFDCPCFAASTSTLAQDLSC